MFFCVHIPTGVRDRRVATFSIEYTTYNLTIDVTETYAPGFIGEESNLPSGDLVRLLKPTLYQLSRAAVLIVPNMSRYVSQGLFEKRDQVVRL